MMQGPERVIMVLGVVSGVLGFAAVTVGVYALVRGRILARDPAALGSPREFGWYSTTLGLAVLLISVGIVLRGPWFALSFVALILAAAGLYRIVRPGRRS